MAVDRKLLNSELGRMSAEQYAASEQSGVVVVLDNVRSAHNVGSVFRSSDAFKVDEVYLCGISPVPPSAELHKTALGAEMSVPWKHCDATAQALEHLRAEGYILVAVEQTERSVSLEKFRSEPGKRYAFVFGNEVAGVEQTVVDICDFSLEIPQYGTKHSLNVSVSAGIVLWQARKFE